MLFQISLFPVKSSDVIFRGKWSCHFSEVLKTSQLEEGHVVKKANHALFALSAFAVVVGCGQESTLVDVKRGDSTTLKSSDAQARSPEIDAMNARSGAGKSDAPGSSQITATDTSSSSKTVKESGGSGSNGAGEDLNADRTSGELIVNKSKSTDSADKDSSHSGGSSAGGAASAGSATVPGSGGSATTPGSSSGSATSPGSGHDGKPEKGATPAPSPTAMPIPTAMPPPVPTAMPTPVPTAMPTPIPTASPVPAPSPVATPVVTPTPGTVFQVEKVGINFEDLTEKQNADYDYNDVVMCFEGAIQVNTKSHLIKSLKTQNIHTILSKHASDNHTVTIRTLKANGSTDVLIYSGETSHMPSELSFVFAKDTLLDITMVNPGIGTFKIDDAKQVLVAPDQCRTGGE